MGSTSSPSTPLPSLPSSIGLVREVFSDDDRPLPIADHPGWRNRFPWLVQGATARGEGLSSADFALIGDGPASDVRQRWMSLLSSVDMERAVLGRQVHGSVVRFHREGGVGLEVVPATDGHATRSVGVLLGVTVADCVPVTVVDPDRRTVAVLHAGWRGTAAGVLEEGVGVLVERMGSSPADLHVHLGPAICGSCYEVGPEVHEALGLPLVRGPVPVDLRAVLARRVLNAGVAGDRVTVSEWCTLCGDSPFFSHRGGDTERFLAFAGIRTGTTVRSG
jgi:YfiH family protein